MGVGEGGGGVGGGGGGLSTGIEGSGGASVCSFMTASEEREDGGVRKSVEIYRTIA